VAGRGTVTGMAAAVGIGRQWRRACWFFASAKWDPDALGLAVARLIVKYLLKQGDPLVVAGDGTLLRRWGGSVAGARCAYDGASQGGKNGRARPAQLSRAGGERVRGLGPGRRAAAGRCPGSFPPARSRLVCRRCGNSSPAGSTGRPKLIAATAPALFENVRGLGALTRMRPDGCVLVTGPISHNAPFVVTAAGMLLGNHVVVMSRFDPAETLRLIEQHRVSWLFLVPTMMLRIWRLPEAARLSADVSSLEVAFHMAAPCPAWLKQAWID
jgi:AMP-binding enzyme/DDE superfamily endonuclease